MVLTYLLCRLLCAKPVIFLIDDNLYLQSMRYEYYQLARKCEPTTNACTCIYILPIGTLNQCYTWHQWLKLCKRRSISQHCELQVCCILKLAWWAIPVWWWYVRWKNKNYSVSPFRTWVIPSTDDNYTTLFHLFLACLRLLWFCWAPSCLPVGSRFEQKLSEEPSHSWRHRNWHGQKNWATLPRQTPMGEEQCNAGQLCRSWCRWGLVACLVGERDIWVFSIISNGSAF